MPVDSRKGGQDIPYRNSRNQTKIYTSAVKQNPEQSSPHFISHWARRYADNGIPINRQKIDIGHVLLGALKYIFASLRSKPGYDLRKLQTIS